MGEKNNEKQYVTESNTDSWVLLLSTETFGNGNEELGKILMNNYIYTIGEEKPHPKSIFLLNEAVKFATVNESTIECFKKLEENGTEILSCGTCLDYYNLKESLKVGQVGNMVTIVEKMNNSKKVVHI